VREDCNYCFAEVNGRTLVDWKYFHCVLT